VCYLQAGALAKKSARLSIMIGVCAVVAVVGVVLLGGHQVCFTQASQFPNMDNVFSTDTSMQIRHNMCTLVLRTTSCMFAAFVYLVFTAACSCFVQTDHPLH
jgi:hypothetical protein